MDDQKRNRVLLLLFIGVLMGALDIAIVGPALPAVQRAFGIGERSLAWIFTIYVLFNLVGTPLMAKLSDSLGRRAIYVADVGLFALGSLIVATAPSFSFVLLGRAIQGLGAGGIFPVASAVIGDTFPPERRGGALGLIGAVFGIAFLIGPILGGALLLFGWRWLFLINLPIALGVIIASLRLLPARRLGQRLAFDAIGMGILGALLASLAYALNQLDTLRLGESLGSPQVWPFLAISLIALPLLVAWEQRQDNPIVRLGLFGSRQIALASVFSAGAGLSEAALVFIPAFIVATFEVSESVASFMLVPAVLAMAIGAPAAGRLLDRQGSRLVVLLAMALLTAGLLMLSLLAQRLALFYSAGILIGLGLSMLLGAPLRYIVLTEAPLSDRASAQGLLTLFTSVGQLVGGVLVGAVAASTGGGVSGYRAAYLLVGLISGLLSLLTLLLKSRTEEMVTIGLEAHRAGAVNSIDGG
ncbi:MAG: MFS transporter [Anaerolineae bacterium]|nr:MFS transporter [Anaerolineae bacterium]MDW8098440.1 MFS transporter [Anaerolineae bacterium]